MYFELNYLDQQNNFQALIDVNLQQQQKDIVLESIWESLTPYCVYLCLSFIFSAHIQAKGIGNTKLGQWTKALVCSPARYNQL